MQQLTCKMVWSFSFYSLAKGLDLKKSPGGKILKKLEKCGFREVWFPQCEIASFCSFVKNLLMPLFLMGCFPGDFQEGKRPLKAFGKRPIKVRKRPIKEGKRPINANGQFSGTLPWWNTAPLKRPIERSMS